MLIPHNLSVCGGGNTMKLRGMPLIRFGGFVANKRTSLLEYLIKPRNISHYISRRRRCDILVVDPLDSFMGAPDYWNRPEDYWKYLAESLRPDCLIATSLACKQSMQTALPDMRVELVQHQYDWPALKGYYKKDGPVVYVGHNNYLSDQKSNIKQACQAIGKNFIATHSGDLTPWQGASLILAVRLPPYDFELARIAKPAIKLENAAASQIPVLASNHSSMTSEFPSVTYAEKLETVDDWIEALTHGANVLPNRNFSPDWYLDKITLLVQNLCSNKSL